MLGCSGLFMNGLISVSTMYVVRKPIINKCLFCIFKFVKEDSSRGRD